MFTMSLPKELRKLFTTDYTDIYIPPLKLPRVLTDEFNKIIKSGDASAIDKYYREVLLPYNYSSDLEREQVKEWDHERAVFTGRKGGETNSEDVTELHQEWCKTRDSMKRKNKGNINEGYCPCHLQ